MSRLFYQVMQDNLGNLLFDVSGTMRLAGSGTLATIYGDEALTVILPNPMTNHPSFGSFKCFLGAGDYDFYMAKSGYTFETLTGVQGHGTMAQQDAGAVNITGGNVTVGSVGIGAAPVYPLDNVFMTRLSGSVGIKTAPDLGITLRIGWTRNNGPGIRIFHADTDSGNAQALEFLNFAGAGIGSITTTGSATSYNTTSDARLKEFIETLVGALDVVRALRPISFRWRTDGSAGHGFLASEVATVVPGVITGEPDEVNPDGTINPQQIDHSKLVVWLVGACQELAARVEALTARLDALT